MGWPELRVGEVMAGRPGVRVNQPGYLLGRPKEATLVSDAEEPRASSFAIGRVSPCTLDFPAAPRLMAPDDHAKFGGGPYPDDWLDDDFYWAAAEL